MRVITSEEPSELDDMELLDFLDDILEDQHSNEDFDHTDDSFGF